jgi:hypothetical protein
MIAPTRNLLRVLASSVAVAAFAAPMTAAACASCSCGDPTLSALGSELPFAHRARVSSLFRYWGEALHVHDGSSHTHAQLRELRMDVAASFSPTDRLTLSATAPLQVRDYEGSAELGGRYAGTGDIEIGARFIAVRDRDFAPRHLLSVLAGLRLPTATPLRNANGLLPEDAQLTTGSLEARGGLAYSFFANPWSTHLTVTLGAMTNREYADHDNVRWSAFVQRQFGDHFALRAGPEGIHSGEGPRFYGALDAMVSPVTDLTLQLGARMPAEPIAPNRLNETVAMLGAVLDF